MHSQRGRRINRADSRADSRADRAHRGKPGGKPVRQPTRKAAGGKPSTGGAFGMSSTRRAALLALVVCALALSIAVPLRTYLAQRAELREVTQQQAQLRSDLAQLEDRKQQLQDPAQLEAEARTRLRYVRPGETPYVVQLPGDTGRTGQQQPAQQQNGDRSWYERLWNTITGGSS